MNSQQDQVPPKEKILSSIEANDSGKLKKDNRPKCRSIACMAVLASLFFFIGSFQTFLAVFYARAASQHPILIMGPMFMGIGLMLYVGVVRMCRHRFRKTPQVAAEDNESDDEDLEEIEYYNKAVKDGKVPPALLVTDEEIIKFVLQQRNHAVAEKMNASPAPKTAGLMAGEKGEQQSLLQLSAKDLNECASSVEDNADAKKVEAVLPTAPLMKDDDEMLAVAMVTTEEAATTTFPPIVPTV